MSVPTAVATRVSFFFGDELLNDTVTEGALFTTSTLAVAIELCCPSLAVTRTAIVSPASPFPGTLRSRVAPDAPTIGTPLRNHSYESVVGSGAPIARRSGSVAVASTCSVSLVVGDEGVRATLWNNGAWLFGSS